jgi:UPF0271 protein
VTSIDLNADLGEGHAYDLALLSVVSSCNIACGGHAGDAQSMAETIRAAVKHDVSVGAHPSYPDRDGFGRRSRYAEGSTLLASLSEQIEKLRAIAAAEGAVLTHVKPHGALYNDAASDRVLAELLVEAIKQETNAAYLVGPPESELQEAARRGDLRFIGEAFVDRVYGFDGRIVPRSEPGAVHSDINTISTQAVGLATTGQVTAQNGDVIKIEADTLCIHGDTKNAYQVALAVRDVLNANGVDIRAAS